VKTTTLYYQEGSSDKIYQATIEPKGPGFVVNFAYGRRGSTLNSGTKTTTPVDLLSAEKLFEKLVREKKAKGYTQGPDGTPYSSPDEAKEYSGIVPQLLNPIEEDELERYIASPEWLMQEKFDGKRLLLHKQSNTIQGVNRKGLFVGIPDSMRRDALSIHGDVLIDGEAVAETYYAFDILEWRGEDVRHLAYYDRLKKLVASTADLGRCSIRIVSSYEEVMDKRERINALRKSKAEGVVFKGINAQYTAGRPNSGGSQLKCKFYATASFIVAAVNKQRSVLLALIKDGKQVPAGNVTVPANQSIPSVGQVVEVRYLYAHQQSGSVYQPTLLGRREDIDPQECTVSQLKLKPSSEEADE
jgi:bifunctional non-homologous end joining protein LigD